MSAFIAMNAANTAYRKIRAQTKVAAQSKNLPEWMNVIVDLLPNDDDGDEKVAITLTSQEQKEQDHKGSENAYERLAWFVFTHFTGTAWFESYILGCIVMIGVSTGVELEAGDDPPEGIRKMVAWVGMITFVSFTAEVVLKIVAEGLRPERYFTDAEDGSFNTFDFMIVVAGFLFLGSSSGGAVAALRMLRLVRLLTFIKGVPQLRVILSGLVAGLRSVTFIVMLLFLIIYLFSIMGCLFLGDNDPARFGTVPVAMLSLFQVSTLASWTSIAYTSWYGCENYVGAPYAGSFVTDRDYAPPKDGAPDHWGGPSSVHTSIVTTMAGNFQGFRCYAEKPQPVLTFLFFSFYIVLTSWVIMSLFIGVISMGMFEAYEAAKTESVNKRYKDKLMENSSIFVADRKARKNLKDKDDASASAARFENGDGGFESKDPEAGHGVDGGGGGGGGGSGGEGAASGGQDGEDSDEESQYAEFGGSVSLLQLKIDRALGDEMDYDPPDT